MLQSDAYGGYNDLYLADRSPGPVRSALCWSHARRKFFELADIKGTARKGKKVAKEISPIALDAVTRIDAIFAVEREITGLSAAERHEVRQQRVAPQVNDLHDWMRAEDVGTKTIHYIYDFGDNWHHVIKVEKNDDAIPGAVDLRSVRAIGACPPEDVGGFPGYADFLEAMANPKHEEHDQVLEWYGGKFDSEEAEIGRILDNFERLAKKWAPKPRKSNASDQYGTATAFDGCLRRAQSRANITASSASTCSPQSSSTGTPSISATQLPSGETKGLMCRPNFWRISLARERNGLVCHSAPSPNRTLDKSIGFLAMQIRLPDPVSPHQSGNQTAIG